ncbi:MAG: Gfo/Idh/MocA family protein [Candidatus Hydrogenedentota bacterium]
MRSDTRRGSMNRRQFLKGSAGAAGAALVFAGTKRDRVVGANDRLRVAVCGVNGQGRNHINGLSTRDDVEVVCLVDPDENVLEDRRGGLQDRVEDAYTVRGETDVRRMLEDDSIDAISVATPNHWHSLIVVWAAQAGKHVYVEKPMSHDVYEGRVALEAARAHGIVVQHGTQQRSSQGRADQIAEIRSGRYGRLKVSHGLACKSRGGIGHAEPSDPPDHLDWNLWRGPAMIDQYHDNYVHYDWHWFWPTGNGDLNNQGTHQLDVAYWALDPEVQHTHPVRVMSLGGRFVWDDQGETPNTQFAIAEFANGQQVFFNVRNVDYDGYQHEVENRFYFEDGGRLMDDGEYIAGDNGGPYEVDVDEINVTPGGRWGSFVEACKANDPEMVNGSPLDAHYSCTMGHLMNISHRLGEKVPFNEKAGRFGDNELAYEEFMKIHEVMRDGVGLPEDEAEYVVGPWLEFDGETEQCVGEHADEANELLRDPRRSEFDIPSPDEV